MTPLQEGELAEIRVAVSTSVPALALSIVAAYSSRRPVCVVAIGPFPLSVAFKAVCTANKTLAPRGVALAIMPGMEMRELEDLMSGLPKAWMVSTMRLVNIMGAGQG